MSRRLDRRVARLENSANRQQRASYVVRVPVGAMGNEEVIRAAVGSPPTADRLPGRCGDSAAEDDRDGMAGALWPSD